LAGIGVQGTELDVQAAFTEVDSGLLTIFIYTDINVLCPAYGSLGGENKVSSWEVLASADLILDEYSQGNMLRYMVCTDS
jgi:hypothetical protein